MGVVGAAGLVAQADPAGHRIQTAAPITTTATSATSGRPAQQPGQGAPLGVQRRVVGDRHPLAGEGGRAGQRDAQQQRRHAGQQALVDARSAQSSAEGCRPTGRSARGRPRARGGAASGAPSIRASRRVAARVGRAVGRAVRLVVIGLSPSISATPAVTVTIHGCCCQARSTSSSAPLPARAPGERHPGQRGDDAGRDGPAGGAPHRDREAGRDQRRERPDRPAQAGHGSCPRPRCPARRPAPAGTSSASRRARRTAADVGTAASSAAAGSRSPATTAAASDAAAVPSRPGGHAPAYAATAAVTGQQARHGRQRPPRRSPARSAPARRSSPMLAAGEQQVAVVERRVDHLRHRPAGRRGGGRCRSR